MNTLKNVCVYSASSTQIDPIYFQAADTLGRLLAQKGINLINGAGCLGLMSRIREQNWHHKGLTHLIETETMHERKRMMADLSDGIIALPGGCGTMEELLEIITWKQLGLYLKPIVILNTNGFYNPLLEMLERAIDQHFMRRQHGSIWQVAQTPDEAIQLLYTTPMWSKDIRKFAAI